MRSCVTLAALVVVGTLAGVLAIPQRASAVMISRPPAAMLAAYQHAQRSRDAAAERAARAARAAQAASAMAALKELLAVPAPAAPPTMAITPAAAPSPPSPTAAAVTPVPVPASAPAVVPAITALPARGHATAYGCPAAMAYLEAYAAPDFIIACGIDRQEHQATTTCISGHSPCSLGRFILIADPCAAAYMNEASNSWVLMGLSAAPIDPYGSCH